MLTAAAEGLAYGGLYALLGIGFFFTYGVMRRIDLSYGTVIMASVYLAAMMVQGQGIGWPVSIYLSLVIAIGTSLIIAYVAFALVGGDARYSMAATLGIWMAIEELLLQSPGGGRGQAIPSTGLDAPVSVFGILLRPDYLILLALSIAVALCLSRFLSVSKHGLALRVAAFDRSTAQLLGISPISASMMATLLAASIGCLAGWAFAVSQSAMDMHFGMWATMKGLVILALAGTSRLSHVVAAALFLGVFEKILTEIAGPGFRDLLAYGLMLFLLFAGAFTRPPGMFETVRS
jgi:branched-chain amino acid transport system permease protein